MQAPTKKSGALSLLDRLSRLSYPVAVRLLGEEGKKLIQSGGQVDILIDEQVRLNRDTFHLSLPDADVSIALSDDARRRLRFSCTSCSRPCEHVGAAFSLILEEKTALGLAAPPREPEAVESLSDEELIRVAIAERTERAKVEKMRLRSLDPSSPWRKPTGT